MLRGLFSGSTPSEGLGHPVTAVGDPFQAIYGWRGAAASNITAFADDFRRADGRPSRRFALTVNRRSGQLDPRRGQRAERPAPAQRRRCGRLDGQGWGCCRPRRGTASGQVRAATFDTWPEEVAWIGDQIVACTAPAWPPRWADIAVLTRRNADIAPLYGELTARDVPVEIVGLGGLLHLPEVMDVTATLRLVDDVTANPDLIRLLTGPRWRIGPRDLALLGRRARELARDPRTRRVAPTPRASTRPGVLDALERAVADVDPTEVVSLLDALENPGDGAVLRRRPAAVRAAGRRARLPAPAQRRAGAGPDPPGDRHHGSGCGADGHPGVRPDRPGATSSAPSWTRSRPTSTWTATRRCPACWRTCRPRSSRAPGWSRRCRRTARR